MSNSVDFRNCLQCREWAWVAPMFWQRATSGLGPGGQRRLWLSGDSQAVCSASVGSLPLVCTSRCLGHPVLAQGGVGLPSPTEAVS